MQFSGPTKYALTYVDWIKDDDRFSDILVQISPTTTGHAFPRLRVRYKSSLVQARSPLHHPKIILFFISCVHVYEFAFLACPIFFLNGHSFFQMYNLVCWFILCSMHFVNLSFQLLISFYGQSLSTSAIYFSG